MNEHLVDILIYLYEYYMDADEESTSDHSDLHQELTQAGFPEKLINQAFDWMDELVLRQGESDFQGRSPHAMRIYTETEQARLGLDARGFLIFLEQNEILDPIARELVIDRAMALDEEEVGVEELKWISLLVLLNQPGQESAFAQMEELVYNDGPVYLH